MSVCLRHPCSSAVRKLTPLITLQTDSATVNASGSAPGVSVESSGAHCRRWCNRRRTPLNGNSGSRLA